MKQYNRILFVAENGTCRAPMAAGILGEYVLKHPVEIGARGESSLVLQIHCVVNCRREQTEPDTGQSRYMHLVTMITR